MEKYKDFKYEIEGNKNNLFIDIEDLEKKYKSLKENKLIYDENKIENEKINIKKNIQNENLEKININKNKIEKIKEDNKNILENDKKTKNKLNKYLIIIFILLLIINFLQFYLIKNNNFRHIFLLTVPMFLIFWIFFKKIEKNKVKNKKNNNKLMLEKINSEINNLNSEINILEKNNTKLNDEINFSINNLKLEIKSDGFYDLDNEIENCQNELNDKRIELKKLEIEEKSINENLEKLVNVEEELVNHNEKMVNFMNLGKSMDLAKEVITLAYDKMKNSITPKFTRRISEIIDKITDGKYVNIAINDDSELLVELDNGNYEPISKLSVGTIDQLYLSLRLCMLDEISKEKMPIILDEVFAYYDTNRLENILKYINENYKEHQIIIFTCTCREKKCVK